MLWTRGFLVWLCCSQRLGIVVLGIMLLFLIRPVHAETIQPVPADWGWVDANGTDQSLIQSQFPLFGNYIAGLSLNQSADRIEFRDFFIFQVPQDIGSISSATLHIYNPVFGYNSTDPNETITFFDVTLPLAGLIQGGSGLGSYFDDLGNGTNYGSAVVSARDLGVYIYIPLNEAALADMLAARGGMWGIGGRVTSLSPGYSQTVFGNTPYFSQPYLTIEARIVPEPSTLLLAALATLPMLALRRRLMPRD